MECREIFNFTRDVVECWANQTPDATALWWVGSNGAERKYSFREITELGRRAADALHKSGVRRGDRVLVVLPRVPQWWIGLLGLIRLGAVPIPGTPLLTARDIDYRCLLYTSPSPRDS